jgi:hypothetical protein
MSQFGTSGLGGAGFAAMPGLYSLGQSGFDAGADRLAQAQRDLSNIILTVSEKRKDRQAQRKQQKRAISAQKKQFWTGLGASIATDFTADLAGAGVLSSLGDTEQAAGDLASTTTDVAADTQVPSIPARDTASSIANKAITETSGHGTDVVQGALDIPGVQDQLNSTSPISDFRNVNARGAVDFPATGGAVKSAAPASSFGDLQGALNPKRSFGQNLGLLFLARNSPTLAQSVVQAPLRAAQIGLGYARLGQDVAEGKARSEYYNTMGAAAKARIPRPLPENVRGMEVPGAPGVRFGDIEGTSLDPSDVRLPARSGADPGDVRGPGQKKLDAALDALGPKATPTQEGAVMDQAYFADHINEGEYITNMYDLSQEYGDAVTPEWMTPEGIVEYSEDEVEGKKRRLRVDPSRWAEHWAGQKTGQGGMARRQFGQ